MTKKESALIDAHVQRMLKEDSIVGRWVRLTFPQQFETMLRRARLDSADRRRKVVAQ